MLSANRDNHLFPPALIVVILLLLVWGGWFIFRSSVVIDGDRYFCLFDDAMISMTYARNVVDGYGLDWTRDGRLSEGFTTPLWTFIMIPVNAMPVRLRYRSLIVQAISLVLLVGNLVVLRKLVTRYFSAGAQQSWLLAVVLTASFYPLDYWALMGMETGLQALLTTAAVFLAYEIVERRKDAGLPLAAVLALAYLVRMDMVLLIVAILAYVAWYGGFRKSERSSWIIGGVIFSVSVGGYQIFRQLYFGSPLPVTYYLKLTGIPLDVRLMRGLDSYVDFLCANGMFLALAGIGAVALLRERRSFQIPVLLFILYSLYSVLVGGDAWEMKNNVRADRFVAFVFPLIFAVSNGILNEIRNRCTERDGTIGVFSLGLRGLVPGACLALFLLVNGLWVGPHVAENRQNLLLLSQPFLVSSHGVVLLRLRGFESIVRPDALVATFWGGIPAYFSDYRMVDMFGYTDLRIARMHSAVHLDPSNYERYTPGHMKWNYGYVFRKRRPDAFFQAWNLPEKESEATMRRRGYVHRGEHWIRSSFLIDGAADPAATEGGSSSPKTSALRTARPP